MFVKVAYVARYFSFAITIESYIPKYCWIQCSKKISSCMLRCVRNLFIIIIDFNINKAFSFRTKIVNHYVKPIVSLRYRLLSSNKEKKITMLIL